jgi:hypothetical protein
MSLRVFRTRFRRLWMCMGRRMMRLWKATARKTACWIHHDA